AHHPVRGTEPERRAAREQDGIDMPDDVPWIERVNFASARGAAAQRGGGAHPARRGEDHRAAGGAVRVRPMSDLDPTDVGETWCHAANLVVLARLGEAKLASERMSPTTPPPTYPLVH